jgi:hypothetical protein
MKPTVPKSRIGELRPSQLLFSAGVGAVVDLPNIAALVMGLDDWDVTSAPEIAEERLLAAVREQLGAQVERLRATPYTREDAASGRFDAAPQAGVPVAAFPRWLVCPYCRLLAPLGSGLFKLVLDRYYSDRSRYVHESCNRPGSKPTALPARFLIACKAGHLDDFPWVWYVHRGKMGCQYNLRLRESGVSGEASEILVECLACESRRSMAEAFGLESVVGRFLHCSGRWPQLRDYDDTRCAEPPRTILLGASNFWFDISLSALAIPSATDALGRLVEQHWLTLSKITNRDRLELLREIGQLQPFATVDNETLLAAIERHRNTQTPAEPVPPATLRQPEWQAFSEPHRAAMNADFLLRPVAVPSGYEGRIKQVVLVERLRQVRALIGFTRIVPPGDMSDLDDLPANRRAPLTRKPPRWVPASEVRGEGIFLQLDEDAIEAWLNRKEVIDWGDEFWRGHAAWRRGRNIPNPKNNWPTLRYVLLHSVSHALMRRLSIECGYSAASISERIYSLPAVEEDGPMAGVLIYTAAADSEGTLGGLVSLGEPESLGRLLDLALEEAQLCSSDPLCAEHQPSDDSLTLHGAACHSCLFAPETACERGNRYLDRSLLVEPLYAAGRAFFDYRHISGNGAS